MSRLPIDFDAGFSYLESDVTHAGESIEVPSLLESMPSPLRELHVRQFCADCVIVLEGRRCTLVCLKFGFYHLCSEP